jgi:hypothetical protein
VTDQAGDEGGRSEEERNGVMKVELRRAIETTMAQRMQLEGKQFALFDASEQLPDDAAEGAAPANVANGKRGRGRPPGSGNKLTEAFRRYVRANYGDPLLRLVSRAFAEPEIVAAQLKLDVGDVWKEQNRLLERLVPYFHSMMPAELKVQAKGFLAVAVNGQVGSLAPGDRQLEGDPFALLLGMQQNQGVSDPADAALNVELLNVETNSREPSDG